MECKKFYWLLVEGFKEFWIVVINMVIRKDGIYILRGWFDKVRVWKCWILKVFVVGFVIFVVWSNVVFNFECLCLFVLDMLCFGLNFVIMYSLNN